MVLFKAFSAFVLSKVVSECLAVATSKIKSSQHRMEKFISAT